ncbi:MAG: hypothetical protein QNL16_10540 [Rhodobacterales bacterium]|nr:hypothetical protein [Pseudomonadota bacterium]MDA1286155.1 hypothetical protein [Pseudomonadota bacterium]
MVMVVDVDMVTRWPRSLDAPMFKRILVSGAMAKVIGGGFPASLRAR